MKPFNTSPFRLADLLATQHKRPFNVAEITTAIHSLWRYEVYLPVAAKEAVSLNEGFTPLLPINMGNKQVYIKQEQLFPTGSYKDRGATVLISLANSQGVTQVVQDSSGNAGCAIAAYAAHAGMDCEIYVPAKTAAAKLAQIRLYGARLIAVEGSREDTAKAALKRAESVFYASHCYHPAFYEGTKTFAYEVCEQLNWKAPDVVVLPIGNGTLVIGCYLGFYHLLHSGIIDKMPQIIGVQSANCAPLYDAFVNQLKTPIKAGTKPTIASGIAIANPAQGPLILEIIHASKGRIITVEEDEIVAALKQFGKMGFYIEPTSAATIAGLNECLAVSHPDDVYVSLFSGHGLKETDAILSVLNE